MGKYDPPILEDYAATAAEILEIPIEPAWWPTILANLQASLDLAMFVSSFELPDESEPAEVFEA